MEKSARGHGVMGREGHREPAIPTLKLSFRRTVIESPYLAFTAAWIKPAVLA